MGEVDPAELTEPLDVVAWLRALPVGTVLLDSGSVAWQLRLFARNLSAVPADGWGESHNLAREDHARDMARHAPFRLLWTPPQDGGA